MQHKKDSILMVIKRFVLAGMLFISMPSQEVAANSCCCDYDCTTMTPCQKRDCDSCHSIFIPRSQHSNSAIFWFGMPVTNEVHCDFWHGSDDLTFEFTRSFKAHDIAQCLFGSNKLHFQGSRVQNRDPNALIADYFGLSHMFDGTIFFKPRIRNVNIHFQKRMQFDGVYEGLWGQINATFSSQTRNLFGSECICDPVSTGTSNNVPFPQGYMDQGSSLVNFLPPGTSLVVQGGIVFPTSDLKQALSGDFLFGNMQTPWKFGRFVFGNQTVNKLAGISLLLGYDFHDSERAHVGVYFQWTTPTGNTPNPTYVFSPVVGNGQHNEVGAGLEAHIDLYRCDDQKVVMWFNGNILTMLRNCQVRSFDFIDRGCLSRYMLLKELDTAAALNTVNKTNGDFLNELSTSFLYAGNLINGINFTTRFTQVKVPVKGDATVRVIWERPCWDFTLGYNIYGQSSERICIKPESPCNAIDITKHYGLKGCTGVATYKYTRDVGTGLTSGNGPTENFLLNSTADATITRCGSVDNPVDSRDFSRTTAPFNSFYVDWTNGLTGAQAGQVPTGTNVATLQSAVLSAPAKEVTIADLDVNTGRSPKQVIHKGFVSANYHWIHKRYQPFVTFGAEIEGNGGHCNLKQWGFWIKGGAHF